MVLCKHATLGFPESELQSQAQLQIPRALEQLGMTVMTVESITNALLRRLQPLTGIDDSYSTESFPPLLAEDPEKPMVSLAANLHDMQQRWKNISEVLEAMLDSLEI